MPCCSDCNADIYSEILRCQTIAALCCALELIGNLELQLNQEPEDATNVSIGTVDAAIDLFNYLVEKKSILRTLDYDNGEQIVNPIGVPTEANTFGVYRYVSCICKKTPFQMLDCPVKDVGDDDTPNDTPGSYTVFLTHLTSNTTSYVDDAQVADFLQALCCLKNHYKQIKAFLEAQKY